MYKMCRYILLGHKVMYSNQITIGTTHPQYTTKMANEYLNFECTANSCVAQKSTRYVLFHIFGLAEVEQSVNVKMQIN